MSMTASTIAEDPTAETPRGLISSRTDRQYWDLTPQYKAKEDPAKSNKTVFGREVQEGDFEFLLFYRGLVVPSAKSIDSYLSASAPALVPIVDERHLSMHTGTSVGVLAFEERGEDDFLLPQSSTWPQATIPDLGLKTRILFRSAREEFFEDGMESEFSRELCEFIRKHDTLAVSFIARVILGGKENEEVSSESLRWMGHIEHPQSYKYRLWLLSQCLLSSSPRIRDGALLGLSFLDDPVTIPALQRAIQREQVAELRKDMEQVLEQLEKTQSAFTSKNYS